MGLCSSTCQNSHAMHNACAACCEKRHGRPNGKKVEKIDARQTRGRNFASAMEATLSDLPEANCLLRLTLCVQQMWERGIPEAAQRPATKKWKFKGGKQILIAVWPVRHPFWSRCSFRDSPWNVLSFVRHHKQKGKVEKGEK